MIENISSLYNDFFNVFKIIQFINIAEATNIFYIYMTLFSFIMPSLNMVDCSVLQPASNI